MYKTLISLITLILSLLFVFTALKAVYLVAVPTLVLLLFSTLSLVSDSYSK
jgi:hypothetical protein